MAQSYSISTAQSFINQFYYDGKYLDELDALRSLYNFDQNEYDKFYFLVYKTKFYLLTKDIDGTRKLNEEEQLDLIEKFIDEAEKGDQFYCILAAEVFIYDLDIQANLNSPKILRMYDRDKALAYLEKAAGLGSGVACNMLGDMLSGWSIDLEKADYRESSIQNLILIKKGRMSIGTSDGKDATEDYFWRRFIDNDKFKVDFDLAKNYYERGSELGNEICKDRLKDYEKRIKKTQRLIGKSYPENSKTRDLMEDEEIEALFDWFKGKFAVG